MTAAGVEDAACAAVGPALAAPVLAAPSSELLQAASVKTVVTTSAASITAHNDLVRLERIMDRPSVSCRQRLSAALGSSVEARAPVFTGIR